MTTEQRSKLVEAGLNPDEFELIPLTNGHHFVAAIEDAELLIEHTWSLDHKGQPFATIDGCVVTLPEFIESLYGEATDALDDAAECEAVGDDQTPECAFGPQHRCVEPGCTELLDYGDGARCPEHRRAAERRRPKRTGHTGIGSVDYRWRYKYRPWFLRHHPTCFDCDAEDHASMDMLRGKLEVHHLDPDPRLMFVESNCMTLCKSHHSTRTRAGRIAD